MPAGYSGTPLPKKLGIKPGARVGIWGPGAPGLAELLAPLPEDVTLATLDPELADVGVAGSYDVIVAFFVDRSELVDRFNVLKPLITQAGGLWIGWPKKAAKMPTNITGDTVRSIGLESGLVDNKVCAIDAVWSGLRFVIRTKDRRSPRKGAKGKRS